MDDNFPPQKDPFANTRVNAQIGEHPIVSLENPYMTSDGQILANENASRMERKRKVCIRVVYELYLMYKCVQMAAFLNGFAD